MSSSDKQSQAANRLPDVFGGLLRALVRIMLRNGVAYASFAEYAKQVYVDVATRDFKLDGKAQTISRVSVLTGINRKEVKRLQQPADEIRTTAENKQQNRAARVVRGWMTDPMFSDAQGNPRELGLTDKKQGFAALVKGYSGDIPVKAILEELTRVGVAEVSADTVTLQQKAYVPSLSNSQMLEISGQSLADLAATLDHNLNSTGQEAHLQLSVAYSGLNRQTVDRFRQLSEKEARDLLFKLDAYLSEQNKGETGDHAEEGEYRAGLGIYYFQSPDDRPAGD